ncbi:MAG: PocR ligand-binding domain-containing protein, partial [Lachnospiraceae bacterium]|nr:PocR ligand-binding domain-containing protein [Lachnospiraceae bacterium]
MEENLTLKDIFSIHLLQELQDSFFLSNGISIGISDQNGVAITEHCSCNPFCSEYTKKTAEGLKRCQECDKQGAAMAAKEGGPVLYNCHAGMLEFAVPIVVDGHTLGAFHGGQVTDRPLDENIIRQLAADLDLDEEEYLEAARKTPIVKREHMENSAAFLHTVGNIISHIAYQKYNTQLANSEIAREANMKSDFLANMSHEIRTPMNAVIGMAEMALREEMTPTARDYVNQIKTAGNSLLTIINDILDFSKINAGKMDINLAEYEPMSVIHDVTNIIMTRIGDKDLTLIIDYDPNIPAQLMGDSIRIKQVIMNLTNNAVKFTRKGYVKVSIGFEQTADAMITLKVAIKDTGIGIKKEDTNKLFQSFQQVDSKRNRNIEGSGLGLAISKQLVELMHGKIWLESEYGSGSTFFFELPQIVIQNEPSVVIESDESPCVATLSDSPYITKNLAKDLERFHAKHIILPLENPLEQLEASDAKFLFVDFPVYNDEIKSYIEEHPKLTAALMIDFKNTLVSHLPNMVVTKKPLYALNIGSIINQDELLHEYDSNRTEQFNFIAPDASILIVDDNEVNLTVARGLMEPFKMHIDTAPGGKEAIQKISLKHYDLIFMDHMMPELDGVETTHIIRQFHEEYNDVPIIALTANAMEEMRSKSVSYTQV